MKIVNRTVHREFELLEILEAGIVLSGAEVKSVKAGNMKLEGAHVRIIGNEVFLVNAEITIYKHARPENYESARSRKLLLHRKEILRLQTKMAGASNLTIVPVSCYNKKYNLKLEIALAKGKKGWQVKKVEQRRDEQRRVEKEMKDRMKQ
jgi:SsrA-binding protein